MKTETERKKESAGLMEAWSYAQCAGETKREKTQKKLYSKNSYSKSVHVCVFNAYVLYKSLQGLTKVLSYFNAH